MPVFERGPVPPGSLIGTLWYRSRATFRRRWAGYLGLALVMGLTGGTAMGSLAGARRTQSSYPTFLARSNPSTLVASIFSPVSGQAVPSILGEVERLPDVSRARVIAAPAFIPLSKQGAPRLATLGTVSVLASPDGELSAQDSVTAVQGRLASAHRADEMVMTASAARIYGAHVGDVVPMGFYTQGQEDQPGFGSPRVAPRLRVNVRLVGIMVFDTGLVQDDIDAAYGFVLLSPALLDEVERLSPEAGAPIGYAVRLGRTAPADVTAAEREILRLLPAGATVQFHSTPPVVTQVELALKPESVALGGFGAIAALVCIVLGAQSVARQVRLADQERRVVRALGATPLATTLDGLPGLVIAALAGAALAMGVAVATSGLFPLGPVRPVYPGAGLAADWSVLGLGAALFVLATTAAALTACYRHAPHRAKNAQASLARSSAVARRAEAGGLPVVGSLGLRFALEHDSGPRGVPFRSVVAGAVTAVAIVVTTLCFASGLHTLVSRPALYGWNWDYLLNPSNDVPTGALEVLSRDRDVRAWTGFDYNDVQLDGQTVPALIDRGGDGNVSPPVLSGHGLEDKSQVVLGASTMAQLHTHIGGTVQLSYGNLAGGRFHLLPIRLRVVGSATFPAVGYESLVSEHTSMGTGAMFSSAALPRAFRLAVNGRDPVLDGPELVFVRLARGVSASAGRANLAHIARLSDAMLARDAHGAGDTVTVEGVQRPAQIVNYRTTGSTPVLLAVGLAGGAVIALGFSLTASVRRRRRDLALLKALGFTGRQLAYVVAWQATVAAVIGAVAGVPLGIALGRELWTLFARSLNAVPDATVPVVAVALVVVSALVFANLVAALPGRSAARTPAALALRAE